MYPAAVALKSWVIWKYVGRYDMAAIVAKKDDKPTYRGEHEVPVLEQEQWHDGVLCLGLGNGKQHRKQNRSGNQANNNRAIPGILNAAPRCSQSERTYRSSNKCNTPIIKIRKGFAFAVRRQQHRRNSNREHRKRDIHPERPTPANQIGEDSAQKGAHQHRHRPTDSHDVQIQGTFTRRNDVGHNGLRKHQQATIAQTGNGTTCNEHRHVACGTAHDRTDQEQHRCNDEQAFPANHIAHLAIYRHSDCAR